MVEKGNSSAGLRHILERHASYLRAKGVTDIPRFLSDLLKQEPIKTGGNSKGMFVDYLVKGNKYRVAYGTNGYIVSFYPN